MKPQLPDSVWLSVSFIGIGIEAIFNVAGADLPTAWYVSLIDVAGLVMLFLGFGVLGYRGVRRSERIYEQQGSEIVVHEEDGLYRIGAHWAAFLWWQKPPTLVVDKTIPKGLRAYILWHSVITMHFYRIKSTSNRWVGLFLFRMIGDTGILIVPFLGGYYLHQLFRRTATGH